MDTLPNEREDGMVIGFSITEVFCMFFISIVIPCQKSTNVK